MSPPVIVRVLAVVWFVALAICIVGAWRSWLYLLREQRRRMERRP